MNTAPLVPSTAPSNGPEQTTASSSLTEKVYLIDGSGYIFRAFYGVGPLSTKDGFPTNALFGFIRMLFKTISTAASQKVVIVFDAGRKTFRNDLDPQYKANRAECPPELLQQMPYFREICVALGLTVLELPGFEADDILGTLVAKLESTDHQTVIVSGDKDLMQLVSDKVTIWDTMKDKQYRAAEVVEKFGVPPNQVVEVLALTGDASDNIKGIDGVGPKTAAQLIQSYQTVEGVISNLDKIKEDSGLRNRKKIAEGIELNPERLRLSRKLVEIDKKVPLHLIAAVPANLDSEVVMEEIFLRRELDPIALGALFDKFEFHTLLKEFSQIIKKSSRAKESDANLKYSTVTQSMLQGWLEQLKSESYFAVDLETTSLAVHQAKIVGMSFCWNDQEAWYVPFHHELESAGDLGPEQVNWEEFKESILPIFKNTAVKKCGQNIKYDIGVLAMHGVEVNGVAFDSMVAAYLLNPDSRAFNLTALANDYLGRNVIEFDEVTGGTNDFAKTEIIAATKYACQDAHYAWLLKNVLGPQIIESGLSKVLEELETPLIPVLSRIECAGVGIDVAALKVMSEEFAVQLDQLEKQIYEVSGTTFNINSPKQLAELLFVKLALPTKGLKKTKTGISTDSSVLERLADSHPLPRLILDYRMLHKLKSTYTDALAEDVSPVTGRIHTKLNQTVTGTGRLSSSDPNLQNIPVQSASGGRIRSAFIPAPGKIFISADYSQIELRLLAHMSEDANLIQAFRDGVDIHASTAREIMGYSATEDLPSDIRRIGKTINFGIVYGMGAFRLGKELGIPVNQASNYINNYFDRYPRVREYFKRLEEEATKNGFVQTIFGRKRMIGSIDTSGRDQGFAMRAAINAPIQGSAADIIKLAMIHVDHKLRALNDGSVLVLQIHDELLVECPDRGIEGNAASAALITETMENAFSLSVPLKVDAGVGKSWQEAQS